MFNYMSFCKSDNISSIICPLDINKIIKIVDKLFNCIIEWIKILHDIFKFKVTTPELNQRVWKFSIRLSDIHYFFKLL